MNQQFKLLDQPISSEHQLNELYSESAICMVTVIYSQYKSACYNYNNTKVCSDSMSDITAKTHSSINRPSLKYSVGL